jgi:hypothetical protein
MHLDIFGKSHKKHIAKMKDFALIEKVWSIFNNFWFENCKFEKKI